MKTFFGRLLAVLIGLCLFFGGIFFLFMMIGAAFGQKEIKSLDANSVLEITMEDPVTESNMEFEPTIFTIGEEPQVHLLNIIDAIARAKEDDKVKGISINLNGMMKEEISQVKLLRDALSDFKSSGKFVYAYTNRLDQNGYYLASVADSIYQNPMGNIEFKGLASEVLFFKNLGEKYGIEFQTLRYGDYKAAAEPFFRENLSPENREQLSEVINGIWSVILKDISADRKLTVTQLNTYADSLTSLIPDDAQKAGMVDALSHFTNYEDMIKKKLSVEDDEKLSKMNIVDYAKSNKKNYDDSKIAILYANGMIIDGDGQNNIQSETYVKAIKKLAKDDKIKAVVLRINSGGGDANTSEEILYEMQQLRLKKPVVVSFGDVAASGGYYIAMENDKIFAEPTTITGSIGVVGMIPNVKKLANNVGITSDYVKTNENAVFYSPMTGLTADGKDRMVENIAYVYKKFIGHVAESRKMPVAQVDSLGGGRIYQGTRAKELGLVDEIGTLKDAIAFAADKAGLEDYQLKSYPQKKNDLEQILKDMNLSTEMKAQLRTSTHPDVWKLYEKIDAVSKMSGTQLVMPYMVEIK